MRVARKALLAALGTGVAALVYTHPATAQDESTNPYSDSAAETLQASAEDSLAPESTRAPPLLEPPPAAERQGAPTKAPTPDPAPAARSASPITIQAPKPAALPAASAQNTTPPTTTEVGAPQAKRTEPNGAVVAGLAIFSFSYLPAPMIAELSSAPFDQLLSVPVAGPWLDLARRPVCAGSGCVAEFRDRALIATDGILQGLGVLMTVAGLFNGDTTAKTKAAKVAHTRRCEMRVSPAEFGAGAYGVAALGRF
jgi:hypothetical protein